MGDTWTPILGALAAGPRLPKGREGGREVKGGGTGGEETEGRVVL